MPLASQVQTLVDRAETLDLIIRDENRSDQIPSKEICGLFETYAGEEQKERVAKSIAKIAEKIKELPTYRVKHSDQYRRVERFESFIEKSIKNLRKNIRKIAEESLSDKLQITHPMWEMPMSFSAETFPKDPTYEYSSTSKTTGQIVAKKIRPEQKISPENVFLIGIVNCDTTDIAESRVSVATLERASQDDLEVFDGIHEFQRIYDGSNPSLGIVKINRATLDVESDNNLAALILEHLAKAKEQDPDVSSMTFYLISESYNIANMGKTSIADITSRIPFAELRKAGITDVKLDLISCNTAEIANELVNVAEATAQENDMTVKTNFYNGYIYNNITYCYIREIDHKILSDSDLETKPTKLFDDVTETRPKRFRVLQVLHPGFSIIHVSDPEELQQFVAKKLINVGGGSRITKKLIISNREYERGAAWQYVADGRVKEVALAEEAQKEMAEPNVFFKAVAAADVLHQEAWKKSESETRKALHTEIVAKQREQSSKSSSEHEF